MSTKNLDSILASTTLKFLPDLCDNWYKGNPFLNALMGSGISRPNDGGTGIQVPLTVAGNDNIGSYRAYDTIPIKPTDEFGYVTFPWRQWAAGLSVCGLEECMNNGRQSIFNLISAKQNVLKNSVENYLSNMLLTSDGRGNNNKDIYGLPRILGGITQPDDQGRTAPIYSELGGIDPINPDCAFWSAWIDDGGVAAAAAAGEPAPPPRPMTLKELQRAWTCIGDNGLTNKPNFIAMGKDLYLDFLAQLGPMAGVNTNGNTISTGWTQVEWLGITVVWDNNIPPGTVMFINTNSLNWDYMSSCYMSQRPWVSPMNQDAKYQMILSVNNLTTCNRAHNGLLCNLRPVCAG